MNEYEEHGMKLRGHMELDSHLARWEGEVWLFLAGSKATYQLITLDILGLVHHAFDI